MKERTFKQINLQHKLKIHCTAMSDRTENPEIRIEDLVNPENGRSTTEHRTPLPSNLCALSHLKKCTVCFKTFPSHADLKRHRRIHTGEKPFQCPYCPKTFAQQYNLKSHCRTHTGERPFACSHCEKKFRNKSDLKRHIRVHTGEKPYCCAVCNNCFSQSNSLKLHATTHDPRRLRTAFLFVDCNATDGFDNK